MDELKQALDTVNNSALVPESIDETLYEELLKLQPLVSLVEVEQADGKAHTLVFRTSHPQGWFEGEGTPGSAKSSASARRSITLKIARLWGSVTGFAQAATKAFINALQFEIEGQLEGMSDVLEYSLLYATGDESESGFTGDVYQTTGILPTIYKYAPENVYDAGGAVVTLAMLDELIASITKWRGTKRDPRLFLMSLKMKQVVDGLQTKVSLPLTNVEIADGRFVMRAYGDTPIFETDLLTPVATSPAVTGAVSAEAGTLPAGDYEYRIAAVYMEGEQVAGASSGAVTLANPGAIDLAWTADDNAVLYMVFRSDDGGASFGLIDIIPALTYAADGTPNGVVESYTDTGKALIDRVAPLEDGEEIIVIANLNPRRGVTFLGLIDDMGRPVNTLVRFVELARTKDSYDFFLKSYFAVAMKYRNMAAVYRRVKRA